MRIMIALFRSMLMLLYINFNLSAQEIIDVINPSFEGKEMQGQTIGVFILTGWEDCELFDGQTPPDIHSAHSKHFNVTQRPFDKQTFLGMVTRETETNEAVGQKLIRPLKPNVCYEYSIYMSRDLGYKSLVIDHDETALFNEPIKLIIWGSDTPCGKKEKLGESAPVKNTNWREYIFRTQPKSSIQYIMLEAYWNTPILLPTNGNILIDKMSAFVEVPCDGAPDKRFELASNSKTKQIRSADENSEKQSGDVPEFRPKKSKSTKNNNTIAGMEVNQFLESNTERPIKDLHFPSDSSSISPSSFEALDEIYTFLKAHPKVKIEISGHTNNIPKDDVCDRLSLMRAEAVKQYLIERGIKSDRLVARGYGKRRPLVSNKTQIGRNMNQRVDIKIIRK